MSATNDTMIYQMGNDSLWHWRLMPWGSSAAAISLASNAVPGLSPLSGFATAAQGAKADTALQNAAAFDASGAAASAQAASQPLDSDLTAIAALSTTAFGRAFLVMANAGATLSALGTTAIVADTGWTANNTAGDKTSALSSYENGLNSTIITALNLAAANSGTVLGAALDVLVIVVKKLAALETALAAGKLPNA